MPAIYRKRRKKQSRWSNTLIFLLAFVIFLVVFGVICLWAVVKINNEQRQTASSVESSTDQVLFTETDALNLLIVTVDDASQPQGFTLVRANPVNRTVRVLSVPRDTVVDYKTSEVRLYELYTNQGVVVARDALGSLLGVTINNYAAITYNNVEKLVDHFEAGVILTLSEDINYSEGGHSLRVGSGKQTLSAQQAANLLRYPSWKAGRLQRADIQGQLTAALVNQYLRTSRKSMADGDFSALVNLCQRTDILRSHYNNAKDMLLYLSEANTGSLASTMTLTGEFQGSGDNIRYYAAENIQQTIASDFM